VFDDHNYYKASAVDCVIYYVCGYIIRKLAKRYKCEECTTYFNSSTEASANPVAALTNIKSKGWLLHPNHSLFEFIRYLEDLFNQYCKYSDVFELIVNHITENNKQFWFSCSLHKTDVMSDIITYYITMRMRQYSVFQNREQNKLSSKKKKLSKLVNT